MSQIKRSSNYDTSRSKKQDNSTSILQEMECLQITYQSLKKQKPEIFATERGAQYIQVDNSYIKLASNMDSFAQLHFGLDFTALSQCPVPSKLSTIEDDKVRYEEVQDYNKAVWDDWWDNKMHQCTLLINQTKKGNYEKIAQLIDANYQDDLGASINF